MNDGDLITPAALAKRWGVSKGNLANLRSAGKSPVGYIKIGGRVGYRMADVLAYEEANYVPAGVPA